MKSPLDFDLARKLYKAGLLSDQGLSDGAFKLRVRHCGQTKTCEVKRGSNKFTCPG